MTQDVPGQKFETVGKFQVSIDHAIGLITIIPDIDISVEEVNEFRTGFLFETGCRLILWDLRTSDLSDVTSEEAQMFAQVDPARVQRDVRLAFVVPRPVDYGVARMIGTTMEIEGSSTTRGQFYDISEALEWLKEPG